MKNSKWTHRILLAAALTWVACGLAPQPGVDVDAGLTASDAGPREVDAGAREDAGTGGDAGPGTALAMYPPWTLEDVQPQSARFGQNYGLSEFAGRPVVAVLLEGF